MRSYVVVACLVLFDFGTSAAFGEPLHSGDEVLKAPVSNSQVLAAREPKGGLSVGEEAKESHPSAVVSTNAGVAIGDQLQVSIFMQYGSGNGPGKGNQGVLPTLVERPDLSGEYTVDEHGMLFLPIAGPLHAAGYSLPKLANLIEAAFARLQEGRLRVGIRLLERQPIYVTGEIPSPAVLKHVPGMTVLQAALLAGANQGSLAGDQTQRELDFARERERVNQSADRLARALARRAVLIAEREGQEPSVPPSLSEISHSQSPAFLSEAVSLRTAERKKVREEIKALDGTLKGMDAELTLMRNNVQHIAVWIGDLEQRVQSLDPMFKQGSINSQTMYSARTDLVNAQEKLQDTKSDIARLERDVAQTTASKAQLIANEAFEREKSLQDVEAAINQEQITQRTMGLLAQRLGATAITTAAARTKFEIVRQTSNGPEQLDPVDEDTLLQPGDILKIISIPSEQLTEQRM